MKSRNLRNETYPEVKPCPCSFPIAILQLLTELERYGRLVCLENLKYLEYLDDISNEKQTPHARTFSGYISHAPRKSNTLLEAKQVIVEV